MKKLVRLIVLLGLIYPYTTDAREEGMVKPKSHQNKSINQIKRSASSATSKSVLSGEDVGVITVLNPGSVNCSSGIAPDITIKNFSSTTVTSVKINYKIDNGTTLSYDWTGNLLGNTSTDVYGLPYSAVASGAHVISVSTSMPNGNADVQPNNDELTSNFLIIGTPSTQLLSQGFESNTTWPYNDYLVLNPDKDKTWTIANTGHSGTKSLTINGFNYNKTEEVDEFFTPAIDFLTVSGTPELSFWLAYQAKNDPTLGGKPDSLIILASVDCGLSWKAIYAKAGADLTTTTPNFNTNSFTPGSSDWRKETISLSPFNNQYILQLKFRHTNYFENNLYIDDININATKTPADIGINTIISPLAVNCANTVTPKVYLRNSGTVDVSSANINYQIDGGANTLTQWAGYLAPGDSTLVSLTVSPSIAAGTHTIKVVVSNPNGASDPNSNNDQKSSTFVIAGTPSTLPLNEDFETNNAWPYNNYVLINPDNSKTWQTSSTGHTGTKSLYINNFNYSTPGASDEFIVPSFDLSNTSNTSKLNFWLAYQSKNNPAVNSQTDTLEIYVSSDCGSNWRMLYQKTGNNLITASTQYSSSSFTPQNSDWRKESIDLSGFNGSQRIYIKFRNINSNGNNLYLDDINIESTNTNLADAGISIISSPDNLVCANSITPLVNLKNYSSTSTLTATDILYNIDGTANSTYNWTGSLAPGATTTVTLPVINISTSGTHNLSVTTSNPNGSIDIQPNNDQQTISFNIAATAQNTFTIEGFESTLTWPYTNYAITNKDASLTWAIANVGYNSSKSIYMDNFSYSTKNAVDEFILPPYNFSGLSGSVNLSFWHAYQSKNNPAANGKTDTLEIYASTDCGLTWKKIHQKTGIPLITTTTPYSTVSFIPLANDWKQSIIDLAAFIGKPNVFIKFKNINNNENNLYIDDINITTTVGLNKAETETEINIFPNPVKDLVNVSILNHNHSTAIITVYNVLGDKMESHVVSADVNNTIINLGKYANGVYYFETIINNIRQVKKVILNK